MTPDERNLINGLFDRLRSVNPGQKDQEADQLIQQSTTTQPDAAYKLVQTLLVQEHALSNAQVRIQQLEKQVADATARGASQGSGSSGGGFLSGLFGHKAEDPGPAQQQSAPPSIPAQRLPPGNVPAGSAYAQMPSPPYPTTMNMPASSGGGFLKSALGTAAGVAGGAALFSGIQSLLGHNSGPFGGGGGLFGGGNSGGGFGGFGGGPEVVENHETINNYYDQRGGGNDNDRSGDGGGSFLGGPENRRDAGGYDSDPNDAAHDTPPTDEPNEDADPYSTPPTDDQSDSMDNNYDADNSDAGGYDNGGGGDDTSYV